ncbi:MAG: divergent PAP2 family protein [Eubacterium sp.]|nr:divergent PAP2 family protein [Eubacterium sp.]
MYIVNQLISNKILISGLVGWATAQILKTIIFLIVNKKLNLERLFGDGGMPSGHSATVSAVALSVGLECGFNSALFAVATIIAIVVMHDAMGVRLETGKQAKYINEMTELIEKLSGTELSNEEKLKEFVGHTPFQVVMGGILGIVVAILLHL